MNAPLPSSPRPPPGTPGRIPDTASQDVVLAPRSRRRIVLAAAAALALLAALVAGLMRLGGGERSVDGALLRIATVTRGAFVSDLQAQGRVVAAVSPTLYAPALGTVDLQVAAGERVHQGQRLARLDSPEVTNEYRREEANLQALRAAYGRERVDVETARLQNRQTVELAKVGVEGAERELRRAQEAHQLGVLPVMEVDRRADELRVAQVRYAHAQDEFTLRNESLDFQLRSRALDVDRQKLLVDNLQRRVDELDVVAPVDGVIGTLGVVQRQAVAANAALMTVVDLSRLEVELQVPETYAQSLGLDMPAQIAVGAQRFDGRLKAISPEVNNSFVTARVAFAGAAPAELRQNQRVTVRVLIDSRDAVVQLPRGSFVDTGGGRSAYVVRDGIARRVPIALGAVAVDRVEVRSGLAPGDAVVIAGDERFENAASVLIR